MVKRRRDGSYPEPAALQRLRESLTEERRRKEFQAVFGREPATPDELDDFIEHLTLEMYNAGEDEW